jgi:uncharacterized repeat protein (TIGR02543 family)
MKKITLLIAACSLTILSFAAGGNITYVLNGGVTNDYGWKNKADMLVGLNQDYNTFYNITTGTWVTWETLPVILAAGDPVTRIPTFATQMWGVIKTPKWLWLHDYILATGKAQGIAAIAEAENANWRYEVSAFFTNRKRATWPVSADYAVAGQPEAFIPSWKQAFAGPATYDGTTEIIIPSPYREGFTFDGWYDNAEFTGNKVTSIAVAAEGDKTLYAKWVEYIPTCAEVKAVAIGVNTKAGGIVTFVNGRTVYIQDATGGLKVDFAEVQTVAPGDKITVSGTVAALGNYKTVSSATLSSSEKATLPAHQVIALATLKADPASYMFEYLYLEGLTITAYGEGNVTLTDDASNTIVMHVTLNQTALPLNTKVNVKAIVSYDTELILVGPATNVTASPVPRPDGATYEPKHEGKYTLKSRWLIANSLDNLSANPIGSAQMVRGMAAKDGKMYFIDREHKRINVVDGTTGLKLAPITLASNIFYHTTRNKANTADSSYLAGTLQYNDIKKDNAGNILISNLTTSNAQPFQVWKIDLATGNGTLVVDEILKANPDFAAAVVRFDAFGVYGDVNTNGIIMAANASAMEAYKWTITNGVTSPAELIIIATDAEGTFLTKMENPGTAPQIFPVDENYFYLDGNATLPTLIDMNGNVVDGFYNVPKTVEDWSIGIGNKQGHNGLIEFDLGGEHFFLMASTNTLGTPPSAFRLFKWANAAKEFSGLESLWTLPAAGMGAASNPYRTAVPSVDVDEVNKVATLYLYTGENGYGVYEFKINAGSSVDKVNQSGVTISVTNRSIVASETVARIEVYNTAGQRVGVATNVSTIAVPESRGVYLVNLTDNQGARKVQKVVIP